MRQAVCATRGCVGQVRRCRRRQATRTTPCILKEEIIL
jgi:hypothetical protein